MKNHERPTAKFCTECFETKAGSFFAKNAKSKDGYLSQCKECRKAKRSDLKNTNLELYLKQLEDSKAIKERLGKDHLAVSKKEWDVKNAIYVKEYRREHYLLTSEFQKNRSREYRAANPEKHLASVYSWMERNPEIVKINKKVGHAKRRAVKKHAYVKWANSTAIKHIYKQAETLTKLTGIAFQVDHIIPLMGKNVCGLHVENNLQILTAYDNIRKYNNFVDDIC